MTTQVIETEEDLKALLAGLPITDQQRNEMTCTLVGHSRIVTTCFGYIHCARCEAQIGDMLGGSFNLRDKVIVGHACLECHSNFASLGWKDKIFTPDPFEAKTVQAQVDARAAIASLREDEADG